MALESSNCFFVGCRLFKHPRARAWDPTGKNRNGPHGREWKEGSSLILFTPPTAMKSLAASLLACILVALCPAPLQAAPSVWCWAPGMSSPVRMNALNLGLGISLGRPYSYRIYGVAGSLSLGDQVSGAMVDPADAQKRFKQGTLYLPPLVNLGPRVNSYSYVKLKVNGSRFYPSWLEVSGDRPAATIGPMRIMGEKWETKKVFGTPEARLDFYLAGLGLGSLLGFDPPYYNLNPYGYFYVVGEYIALPPQPTGTLTINKNYILKDSVASVGYYLNRGYNVNGETPPFSGYDPSGEVLFVPGN